MYHALQSAAIDDLYWIVHFRKGVLKYYIREFCDEGQERHGKLQVFFKERHKWRIVGTMISGIL